MRTEAESTASIVPLDQIASREIGRNLHFFAYKFCHHKTRQVNRKLCHLGQRIDNSYLSFQYPTPFEQNVLILNKIYRNGINLICVLMRKDRTTPTSHVKFPGDVDLFHWYT